MKKKYVILLSMLILASVSFYFEDNISLYSNEEQLLAKIIEKQGYNSHIKSRVPIEIHILEEWIPDNEGEKIINQNVAELYSSEIVLKKVISSHNQFTFDFVVETRVNKSKNRGEFLSVIDQWYSDVETGLKEEWELYGEDGADLIYDKKLINSYGSGEGPSNQFSFSLDKKYEEIVKSNLFIKYSGLVLYEYSRR